MRFISLMVVCVWSMSGADKSALQTGSSVVQKDRSLLQTDKKGVELGAFGLRVAAVDARATLRVSHGIDRILLTPVTAAVEVSREGVLVARLSPGTTYYFGEEGQEQQNPPKKGGVSRKVKWGIAAGVAAGVGVGLGVALKESDPVSKR